MRIMRRIFALTPTHKYLEIGIKVGPASFVELILGDIRGHRMVLPYATWTRFIERRADIERFLQSTTASPLQIRDLTVELTTIRDVNVVKLILHDTCLYMKPSTVVFMFQLEHCVEHVYFKLCQIAKSVSERYTNFIDILRDNFFTDNRGAATILRQAYDKTSIIDCELLAYALDPIVYDAIHHE